MGLYARLGGPGRGACAGARPATEDPMAEAAPSSRSAARAVPARALARFDSDVEVVVVGHGAAGGCAAIEAARAGARVLVLERASRGGGAAALSTGLTY